MSLTLEQQNRRIALINRRREAIIFGEGGGPKHPQFGVAFMRYFLPHYCAGERIENDDVLKEWIEPADWHPDLDRIIFGSMGKGQFHVHEAPRGWAKSTKIALAQPLATMGLTGIRSKLPYRIIPKHYLWIVSDSADQAKMSMEAILAETETNPRVLKWFPHLTPQLGRHKRPVADRDDDVVFNGGIRLQALSAGMKLRGRRHRQYRPDLGLVDDLENDEAVHTKFQRDKLDGWFSKSLLPALAKGADLHYLGTPLHVDGQLYRLKERAGFLFHRYEALTDERIPCPDHGWHVEGTPMHEECDLCQGAGEVRQSTWPAYRDAKWHARARATMGSRAYTQEVLLQPIDEDDQMFKRSWFQYAQLPQSREEMADGYRVRIGVDPAVKTKTKNDYSAIVVAGKKRGDRMHDVLWEWHGRKRGAALRKLIMEAHAQFGGIVVFESVTFAEWGKEILEDLGIPIKTATVDGDKVTRAEPVALHYEMGRVRHHEGLRDTEFETIVEQFPNGEHDDPVDALVYAITELDTEVGMGMAGSVQHESAAEGRARREQKLWLPRQVGDDELWAHIEQLLLDGTPIPWDRLTVATADRMEALLLEQAELSESNDESETAEVLREQRRYRPAGLPSGANDPRFS